MAAPLLFPPPPWAATENFILFLSCSTCWCGRWPRLRGRGPRLQKRKAAIRSTFITALHGAAHEVCAPEGVQFIFHISYFILLPARSPSVSLRPWRLGGQKSSDAWTSVVNLSSHLRFPSCFCKNLFQPSVFLGSPSSEAVVKTSRPPSRGGTRRPGTLINKENVRGAPVPP